MNSDNKVKYMTNISGGGTPNAYQGPTLHDSKSLSYLKPSLDDTKKFRETTFHPITTKNNNLEFLRYTVNINRNQQEKSGQQLFPTPQIKLHRQKTEDISLLINKSAKQKQKSLWKPETNGLKSPSKNYGTNRKIQNIIKDINSLQQLSKSKHICRSNYPQNSSSVTDRYDIKNGNNVNQKKSYTPKLRKAEEIDKQRKQGKIISSFSSIDLVKKDHAKSPTSDSISSRNPGAKDKKQCWPSNFDKVKYLGEGKFGQVHLVRHQQTNSLYALKQIKKELIVKNNMEQQLLMEIKMQSFFNHPNILKLYGFFDDQENIYLILEYMEEGTLYSQLRKQKTLKQSQAGRKLRDVLEGVQYLHEMAIAHRDLKPQNIVVSNDVCKICDLGWAAICEDRRTTLCGTIDYASPEILQGKQYGIAIDLWCLGVLCYELMIGKAPFYHISRKQTMKKIINADTSDIDIPKTVPNQTRDFIGKLLKKDPEERMSAQQALIHPLIIKYIDEEFQEFRLTNKQKN